MYDIDLEGLSAMDIVRLHIMNGQTRSAIRVLYAIIRKEKLPDLLNQLIIIASNFSHIIRLETIGTRRLLEERSQINLGLLNLLGLYENQKQTIQEEELIEIDQDITDTSHDNANPSIDIMQSFAIIVNARLILIVFKKPKTGD